jgi:DNA-binding NarL/FixJ family response regulator
VKVGSILLVDDEEIILGMLETELQGRYEVLTATCAEEAFERLEDNSVDLVISDINMPGMKGYELLNTINERYPHIKTALITGYNTDNYIRMAKTYNISNIIPKSVPFNFDEFHSVIESLITEDIFGLQRYLNPGYTQLGVFEVDSSTQILDTEQKILDVLNIPENDRPFVHILLEELITNAVYHAPVDDRGHEKYHKHMPVKLQRDELVRITVGKDEVKYGVSVVDTSGKLTKEQVLYRLDRHIHGEGLCDKDGRGLHMSRLFADSLIINIKRNVTTEVIFINNFSDKYHGHKPLYINEI